ncbi:hypothetical protein NT239_16105 [Chitinibacter sp. SCUT-21]|uniref:hypothetical protein n=1 Tax=Chitinibacter sp. SCUT-21 TaxID=2970891 RepID=UPI0035A7066B
MRMIPKEVLIAATKMAKLDGLTPEQTMSLVFRALDHELSEQNGRKINLARTPGIGKAIYAALFAYPVEFIPDQNSPNGWCWDVVLPEHGYGQAFEQMFLQAQINVDEQRQHRKGYSQTDIAQNQRF